MTRVRGLTVLAVVALVLRVIESRHLYGHGFDAHVYWNGARAFLDGTNPYKQPFFVTPPPGLPVLAPLAWLSLPAAYTVSQTLAILAIIAGLFLLLRDLLKDEVALCWAVALTALLGPAFLTFGFGSLNGLILLTYALALKAGTERGTGLWFGIGFALKPILAPVALILLAQRRWAAAIWALVFPAITGLIALLCGVSLHDFFHYTGGMFTKGLSKEFSFSDISLRGTLIRHHLSLPVIQLLRIFVALVALAIAVQLWRRSAPVRGSWMRFVEVGSAVLIGVLLAGPFAWRYYTLFLVPLAIVVFARWSSAHLLTVAGFVVLMLPDSFNLSYGHHPASFFDPVISTSALFAVLAGLGISALRT